MEELDQAVAAFFGVAVFCGCSFIAAYAALGFII